MADVFATKWEVRISGPLAVLREGERFRLRTRPQELLLLRLVFHSPHPIDRADTAALLWPEASHSNALAYLRRAVMEMREAGIAIDSNRSALWLNAGAVESQPLDWHAEPQALLRGTEHPIADEVRRIVAGRLKRLVAPVDELARSPGGAETWLIAALLRERPDVALDLIAREGPAIVARRPPAEMLELCEKALAAAKDPSSARGTVHLVAARASMLLTRYGLAERHFVASLDSARRHADESLATKALTAHAFMLMEIRRWEPALERARRAVEAAERLGDPDLVALTHNNMGGILWHVLRFDECIDHYRIGERMALNDGFRMSAKTNLTYLWAIFRLPEEAPEAPDVTGLSSLGSEGVHRAYFRFAQNFGYQRFREASAWAATLLDLVATESQERLLCVALDCAALVLAASGQSPEAAAVIRLGSRLRRNLGHGRSPGEALAIRRHVRGKFFGPETTKTVDFLEDKEPSTIARHIASRLRITALSD